MGISNTNEAKQRYMSTYTWKLLKLIVRPHGLSLCLIVCRSSGNRVIDIGTVKQA